MCRALARGAAERGPKNRRRARTRGGAPSKCGETVGAGADFDVLPELRLSANINHLAFANRSSIELMRNQLLTSNNIGWDLSVAAIYRPTFIQNVVFRASAATLFGGESFKELFLVDGSNGQRFYSVLLNMILTY